MKKLCLIYNTAPLYRAPIFRAIDRAYDCDWYFGETKTDIKEMDLSELKHTQYYKSCGNPQRLYWQGALIPGLFKRKYKDYFVLAEERSVSFWLFVLLKALFFPKKRIFGWSHGWYGREGKWHRRLARWRMKGMDGMFVYNERARRLMIEGGIPEEKVFTIYNSLDYDCQKKLREELPPSDIYRRHFGNDHNVIIFIGRLTAVKRLDMMLRAVTDLKKRGEDYNVVFIGNGTEKGNLQKLASELEVPAWFYGACYDERTNAELVASADLCVSPGNVGLTAIHTLTFGTPVITNDDFNHQMPEFESIVPGVTGGFFKAGDEKSLADEISRWFAAHPDRQAVREACYAEIDGKWNPENQMRIIKAHI
ncbi:MAG: glycosyltransferase family 4 protein [Muribaculaceae bacterium]|nr:glycosyltransferase family 4 protein [Muribaculaceae bacterium]